MKWQIILISAVILIFMSFSTVWANDDSDRTSESQIKTSSLASITPLMKSSSGSSKSSSSSSSSKTKIHDGDDDTTDDNSSSSNGGFPWWIIAIIVVVILGIIGFVVWYFFLR